MDPPPRTHSFVACQDPLACTSAGVRRCHHIQDTFGPECNLPLDHPVHAWHTSRVVEAVDTGTSVPGFHWTYLYCQYPGCYRGSAVKLIPDHAQSTAIEWTACEGHSLYRPPVKADPHWRAPSSPRYTLDGRPT